MHDLTNHNFVWVFLVGCILLGGAMLYFAPKITRRLGKTSDSKLKSREPRGKKVVRRYKTF